MSENETNELVLDLAVESFTLTKKDKEGNPVKRQVELRELTGKQRDKYLTGLGNKVRYDKDGKAVGLKDFDGLQASLVTQCLFDVETGKTLSLDELQEFPTRVLGALFIKAKKMSGLDEEAETNAGND